MTSEQKSTDILKNIQEMMIKMNAPKDILDSLEDQIGQSTRIEKFDQELEDKYGKEGR